MSVRLLLSFVKSSKMVLVAMMQVLAWSSLKSVKIRATGLSAFFSFSKFICRSNIAVINCLPYFKDEKLLLRLEAIKSYK